MTAASCASYIIVPYFTSDIFRVSAAHTFRMARTSERMAPYAWTEKPVSDRAFSQAGVFDLAFLLLLVQKNPVRLSKTLLAMKSNAMPRPTGLCKAPVHPEIA